MRATGGAPGLSSPRGRSAGDRLDAEDGKQDGLMVAPDNCSGSPLPG